jgi:hypothetical protein
MLFKQPEKWRLSRFFVRILPEVKRGVEIVTKTRRAWPLLTVNGTAIFAYLFFLRKTYYAISILKCIWVVLSGLTRRRNKIYHWDSVGKGLGENGMNGACEMEMSISRSRGVLKCMIGMQVQWSIRGQREERAQLLERSEAKMEIIYCKHMDKQLHVFYFLHNWWVVGKYWGLRAAERGKSVDLCAAIIYNVSLCAFLSFINIEILYLIKNAHN